MDDDSEMAESDSNLVYPKIESIYSNINIKTEVSDYEDDELEEVQLSDYETNEYYMPIPNKIILGTKPPSQQLEDVPEPAASTSTMVQNSFQCDKCNIFFSTQNDLDSHENAVHSFLVARPISRSRKSPDRSVASMHSFTEDSSQDSVSQTAMNNSFPIIRNALKKKTHKAKTPRDNDRKFLCSHCNVQFPNEIELIKHTYELIPENVIRHLCGVCGRNFPSLAELNAHRLMHKKKKLQQVQTKLLRCTICSLYLIQPGSLRNHLSTNHNFDEISLKPVSFKGKCTFCARIFPNYRLYNKHIPKAHQKIYTSKKLIKHKEVKETVNLKVKANVYSKVRKLVKPKPILSLSKTFSGKNTAVPKRTLFKCNKCQIHFLAFTQARDHSLKCYLTKHKRATWNCNKCGRTFRALERHLHTIQHNFSDKFEVHTVIKGMFSKILCKCPGCQLYFAENDFWDHVAVKCEVQTAKTCDICKLKIPEKFHQKHIINHRKYNHTRNDLILVEYVDAVNVLGKDVEKKNVLYYCEICKTYMFQRKKRAIHDAEQCGNLTRKLCVACGLLFPKKTLKKHIIRSHQIQNLMLRDYTFFRMNDGEAMHPPLPDFFPCSTCGVRFSSVVDVKLHDCQKHVSKTCKKCNTKFDDTTYKLHLEFHNYNESRVKVKSENVSRIFFCCASCGYGFDHYDNLVRHCQDHFNNTKVARTRKCDVCNLLYPNAHGVHDSSFRILSFKYDMLLTDRWWDGFKAVSKKVKDNILAESAYGFVRNVRLDVIKSGPSNRVLYKCVQCNLYFNIDAIVSHAGQGCSESPRLPCESCHAVFSNPNALEEHLNIHVVYGDDIEFLEVAFNDPKDTDLNKVLMKEIPKESLKFRKCSFCDLLVKKDEYQQHMDAHDCQKAETIVSRVGVTYKLYPPKDTKKRMYTAYKCAKCSQTIMRKNNISRHNCSTSNGKKCSKCSLSIRKKFANHHNELHIKLPKFVTKNIKVVEFEIQNKTDAANLETTVSEITNSTIIKGKVNDAKYARNEAGSSLVASKSDGYKENDMQSGDSSDSNVAPLATFIEGNFDIPQEEKIEEKRVNKKIVKYKLYPPKNGTQKRLYSIYRCKHCTQSIMYKLNLARHSCNFHRGGMKCGKCSQWIRCYSVKKHEMLHRTLPKFLTKNINVIEFELLNDTDTKKTSNSKIDNETGKPVLEEPLAISYSPNESVEDKEDDNENENEHSKGPYVLRKSRAYSENVIKGEISEYSNIEEDVADIDDTLVMPNINNMLVKVYQCSTCYMSFTKRNVLIEHQLKCTETVNPLVCSQCDLTYHSSNSTFHERLHESDKIGRIYLTRISTKGIRVEDEKSWLYRCDPCDIHYLTWRTLQLHLDSDHHGSMFTSCDICNLRFTVKSRTKHKRLQHDDEWCLENLNMEIVELKRFHKESMNEDKESIDEKESINESSLSPKIEDMLKVERVDHNLYRCTDCCLNFLNKSTLHSHLKKSRHEIEKYICDVCGLKFSYASMPKHSYVQHKVMKLKREDFHITTMMGEVVIDDNVENKGGEIHIGDAVENNTSLDKVHDESDKPSVADGDCDETNPEITSVDTDIVPLIRLKNTTVRKLKNKKIVMYQCKDCNVCVQKRQMKHHICFSDLKKKQCLQCSLSFARMDFGQHLRLHKRLELSRKNYTLVKFGRFSNRNRVYKCVTCSTHFLGLAALEAHMDRAKHDSNTVTCDVCQLDFSKSSISRHLIVHHTKSRSKQFDIFCVRSINDSLTVKETSETNSDNLSECTASSKDAIKLFRCVECDVFFLTQDSYYQHMYKHTSLDPTEFIECKMCQLPFLTESLADHMKTHKDKTFYLDHVVIESFDPTSGQSVTKGYRSVDLVAKHIIVSTTTTFDEVEEKNDEQQSTVDSTSDVNS